MLTMVVCIQVLYKFNYKDLKENVRFSLLDVDLYKNCAQKRRTLKLAMYWQDIELQGTSRMPLEVSTLRLHKLTKSSIVHEGCMVLLKSAAGDVRFLQDICLLCMMFYMIRCIFQKNMLDVEIEYENR